MDQNTDLRHCNELSTSQLQQGAELLFPAGTSSQLEPSNPVSLAQQFDNANSSWAQPWPITEPHDGNLSNLASTYSVAEGGNQSRSSPGPNQGCSFLSNPIGTEPEQPVDTAMQSSSAPSGRRNRRKELFAGPAPTENLVTAASSSQGVQDRFHGGSDQENDVSLNRGLKRRREESPDLEIFNGSLNEGELDVSTLGGIGDLSSPRTPTPDPEGQIAHDRKGKGKEPSLFKGKGKERALEVEDSPIIISDSPVVPANYSKPQITPTQNLKPPPEPLSSYACPICFSPPTNATLTPCGHICCGECLFTAVKTTIQRATLAAAEDASEARCPVCRAVIPGWDGKGAGVIGLKPRAIFSL